MKRYPFCPFRIPQKGKRVIWEITNQCNYACSYCIFNAAKEKMAGELSTAAAIRVMGELKKNGFNYLKITGGEPFIRRDIFAILRCAKKAGFSIDVSTNASLIDTAKAKCLKDLQINMIHVGLDGDRKNIHEMIRGRNSFYQTVAGIKELVRQGIYTRVGSVIFRSNENRLEALVKFCLKLQVNEVVFSLLEAVGRMQDQNTFIASIPIAKLKDKINRIKRQYAQYIKIGYSFPEEKEGKNNRICPAGDKFIYIDHYGKVFPCTWLAARRPELVPGQNIRRKELANILHSKEFMGFKSLCNKLGGIAMVCPARQRKYSRVAPIYSFTTEKIVGYFPQFNFTGKKILTVGGSGDHIINAFYLGAAEVTAFDVNEIAKMYVELKIAGLKKLNYKEFMSFFLRNYNKQKVFSYQTYLKIRKDISLEARAYFNQLYKEFQCCGQKIRESTLFNNQYDIDSQKLENNIYLKNANNFSRAARDLVEEKLNWLPFPLEKICRDNLLGTHKYDLIMLSNIADYAYKIYAGDDYLERFKKEIVDKLFSKLKPQGVIIFAYVYDCKQKGRHRTDIDDPIKRHELFGKNMKEYSFKGVAGRQDLVAYYVK